MPLQSLERTEQKLEYARIHLDELQNYTNATSNDDWENAHQESCFYHLAGAAEAILHEVNEGYSLGLSIYQVDRKPIRKKLKSKNLSSPAFSHLNGLKNSKSTWLSQLFEWRNHGNR